MPSGARLLVVAVVVEFLVLRILNRMTGSFPVWAREQISVDLVLIGTLAYNFGYVLAALVLAAAGWLLVRQRQVLGFALVLWVPALVGSQLLGSSSPVVMLIADVFAASLLVVLVARAFRLHDRTGFAHSRSGRVSRLRALGTPTFLALVLGTYLGSFYLRAGDAVSSIAASVPFRSEAYRIGEFLGLGAAILAPVLSPVRPRLKLIAAPAAAVGLLGAMSVARPDIIPLIAFWSLGFQVLVPIPVYLVALGAFAYALVASRGAREPYLFWGLLLVFLGGRLLADFYFVQIALVAVLLVGLGRSVPAILPRGSGPSAVAERRDAAWPRVG